MLEVVNKDLAVFNTDVESSYVWCICRNFLVFSPLHVLTCAGSSSGAILYLGVEVPGPVKRGLVGGW